LHSYSKWRNSLSKDIELRHSGGAVIRSCDLVPLFRRNRNRRLNRRSFPGPFGPVFSLDKNQTKNAAAMYRTFLCLWFTIGLRQHVDKYHAVQFISFIERMLRHILKDEYGYYKELKRLSQGVREHALRGSSVPNRDFGLLLPRFLRDHISGDFKRRSCVQGQSYFDKLYSISMLNRALPVGNSRVAQEARVKHAETVHSVVPPLSEPCLLRIRNTCHYVKSRLKHEGKPSIVSTGACIGATRKEGGRSSLMNEVLGDYIPCDQDFLQDSNDNMYELGKCTLSSIFDQRNADRLEAMVDFVPLPDSCPVEIVTVAEHGFKIRIVTKSLPEIQFHGHRFRERLWSFMKTEPTFVLEDPPDDFIVANFGLVFSSDLTAATDTLSHEALDIVSEVLEIPSVVLHKVVDSQPWTRGCPMGSPVSWCVLSIIHFAVAFSVDKHRSFRIKGDDLLARWPKEAIRRYRLRMTELGFVVKPGGVARHSGTFCEKPYHLLGNEFFQGADYLPLRWVSCGEEAYHHELERMAPALIERTRSVHKYLSIAPEGSMRLIQRVAFRELLQLAKDYSIDPYVPLRFGGLGLVPPRPKRKPSKVYQYVCGYIHNNAYDDSYALLAKSYPKGSAGRAAAEAIHSFKPTCIVVGKDIGLEGDSSNIERAVFMASTINSVVGCRVVDGEYSTTAPRPFCQPRVTSFLRALKDRNKKILRTKYSCPLRFTYESMYNIDSNIVPDRRDVDLIEFAFGYKFHGIMPDPGDPYFNSLSTSSRIRNGRV